MVDPNESDDKMLPLNYTLNANTKGMYRAHVIKSKQQVQLQEQGAQFDTELKEILRKGDVFRFRNFLSKSNRNLPTEMMLDTTKMETMMHQLILAMPELTDIHERSQNWLDNNTFVKTRGLTLLQSSRLTPVQKKQLVTNENAENDPTSN